MSSNQSINKTPNSRFLLFSHRCTQTLGFKCLSISRSRWTRINPSDKKHWLGFLLNKKRKNKKINFFSERLWFHETTNFDFFLTHLPTLHQFLLFYKMSYVLHQMSDITTTKQQVIKKNNLEFLPNFVKVKDTKSKKKKEFMKPRKSRFPPTFFFSNRPPNQSRPQNNIIKIVAFVWKKSGFWIH